MPTTLRDYLASLPNASGTLDADDKLPALEDGTLVGATAAQIGAGGGGVTDGDKGDIVVSASGTVWLIDYSAADVVPKSLYDANTILAANTDNAPAALTVAASRIVGRKASGSIAAMTGTETAALLPAASTTLASVVELADNTEAITGTDTARAMTPAATTAGFTPRYLTINAQTGTTYTLALTDDGDLVSLSNAGAITLTVPTNASVAFPVGTQVHLAQLGAGQVTIVGAGGVTVNGTPGLKHRAQYSAVTVIKVATDTWLAVGDLAA